MPDRWTELKCTFYGRKIQISRPEMVVDDQWDEMVRRLERVLFKGTEMLSRFGLLGDEEVVKPVDLPGDITKKLVDMPAKDVEALARASEEIGEDELEQYQEDRERNINSMLSAFVELTFMYSVRGDKQSAVEIAKMVMDLDNVSLKSAERIQAKLQRSIDSHLPRVTEDGTKPMGITRGLVLTSEDDTESRPDNGCVDCKQRDGQDCDHPDRPASNPRVATYLENALKPGSPTVVPGWCPLVQGNRKRVG
jgi:hypothetical protein